MARQSPLSQRQPIVNKDGTPTAWFIRLWQEQLTVNNRDINDSDLVMHPTTVNDATIAQHGFLPALSGDADTYLNGLGQWTEPPGGDGQFFSDGLDIETGVPILILDLGS